MCDCVQSYGITPNYGTAVRKLAQFKCNSKPAFLLLPVFLHTENIKTLRVSGKIEKPLLNLKVRSSLGAFDSNGSGFGSEIRLKKGEDGKFDVGLRSGEDMLRDFIRVNEDDDSGLNSLKLKREKKQNPKFDDSIGSENGKSMELKEELQLQPKGKQLMKRSSLLAKQVIGIQSALSFGFVSQLWVDTASWVVLEVEARPNLLSSESGKFLVEDIKQIGDVVLVQDDRIRLNEFRTIGLETLVGYNVVTPGKGHLGKVRSYSFDINSGALESLELDAFGYSIIPSSLVSTYALFTEDVLEVASDTIFVHEAAASRIQRLTKGFLGTKSMEISSIDLKYSNLEEEEEEYRRPIKGQKSRRKSSKRKFYPGTKDFADDLELPMDYM